ncbi:MAG TPA: TetR/AcrR family transcriptional regulator [Burkholderiales bacterium]|nr:TetR/AcrR family transcriptional regulator [Burkholderiales bacterium]
MPTPRWERRKEARPAELLAAALELFGERGYAATRLEDVARRAGVSKGTVYLYFPGKEELFKAVVREGLVPLLERGEAMVAQHQGSAVELIRDLVRGWWEGIGLTPYAGIPKLMISECRNFPELGKFYVDEVIARGHKLVRAAVCRGMDSGEFRRIDPEHVTRLVFAPLVLMVIYRYSFDFCGARCLEPDAYIEQHLDILLRGLLAPARGRLRAVRSAVRA